MATDRLQPKSVLYLQTPSTYLINASRQWVCEIRSYNRLPQDGDNAFHFPPMSLSLFLCPVQAVELPVSYQSTQCFIWNYVVYFYSAVDVHTVVCNFRFLFFIIFMMTKCLRLKGVDYSFLVFCLIICHFYDLMWLVLPWTVYTLKWAQTHVLCVSVFTCVEDFHTGPTNRCRKH